MGVAGAAGTAGWALRNATFDEEAAIEAKRREQEDETGLPSGGAGALGIHRVIYSVAVADPIVALTFDDGPDPEFTPRVLEILAGYGIRATFNVMGYNAVHHDDILKEVVAAGHEIGNHTWTHHDLSTVGAAETAYEIRRGREVIEDLTGSKIRFFRPPRGEMNGAAMRIVAEEGNDILMWSITGSVPGRERPDAVNSFVLSHLAPGAIIDFHDGIGRGTFDRGTKGARALIERRTAEIEGLPKLLEASMAKGFEFMRVGDLLEREQPSAAPATTTTTTTSAESGPGGATTDGSTGADADAGEPDVSNPPDATIPGAR